jgi:hypothetical protein
VQSVPDKFDAEFWTSIIKLLSKLAVFAVVAIGGAGGAAEWASTDLRTEELTEAKWNIGNEYGEALQDYLIQQAACDTALESFARHRDDEEDWARVLRECHSGEQ